MGLPIGPTFTNTFWRSYQSVWLSECPAEFRCFFHRKYVAHSLCRRRMTFFFRHKMRVLFLNYLKTKHCNIKFAIGYEFNNKLPFLAAKLHKHDNRFECSI